MQLFKLLNFSYLDKKEKTMNKGIDWKKNPKSVTQECSQKFVEH